jgi:hypothetical protein
MYYVHTIVHTQLLYSSIEFPKSDLNTKSDYLTYRVGCENKDLDGYLGPLGKFIEYCRMTALLPVIPLGIRNNW